MSAYTKELHAILRELAVENSDYPLAYSLQNRLHAIEFSEWMEADRLHVSKLDSLQQVIEKVEKNSMEELGFSRNQTMQWHIIAVIGIGAVIILFSLLLIFRLRWKRKLMQLTDKVNDKSEEEMLVQKLEHARREISELRVVAKKKVEPALSDAISPLPAGASVSATEIAQWNDQIQQALVKIKSHCEAGKSSMGVPTYMSIINDTGRLSSLVQQKSEEWIALLNAKKDIK
jgi:transposase